MKTITGVILFLLIIGISDSYAQKQKISGTVRDASDNQPLSGASVLIQGTRTGVATDLQGKFTIMAEPENKLVVSFIGMKSQVFPVKNNLLLDIRLEPDSFNENEIVIIGFGTTSGSSYAGSASTLRREQFSSRPLTNVLQALDGSVPGLNMTSGSGQPGSSPDIRLRGIGSITALASPLYVVDGSPYSGDISGIPAEDVENISVLKDAEAAALYGSRGANGVIIITTRKGKATSPSFRVKINQGFSTRGIPEYDRVDAYEYYPLMWEAYRNSMVYRKKDPLSIEEASQIASFGNNEFQNIATLLGNNPFGVPNNEIVGTNGSLNPNARLLYADDLDWEKAMTRIGHRGDYSISASGGTPTTTYYMSVNYTKERGYILKSDLERTVARVNVTTRPNRWLQTGVNLSGGIHKTSSPEFDNNTGYSNPFFFTRNLAPIYPIHQHAPSGEIIYDASGRPLYESTNRGEKAYPGHHIIAEAELNNDSRKQNIFNSRAFAELRFMEGLTFTFNAAYDLTNNLSSQYENPEVGSAAGSGRTQQTNDRYDLVNFNQLLNFKRRFGKHGVEALLGHESFSNTYKFLYGKKEGIISDGNDEFVNFTTIANLSSHTDQYRTEGYFMRLGYNYGKRYSLSGSYRRDGSSRFQKDVRWGNFWSVGAAWQINHEKFMTSIDWIDQLKLRASYGQTGNDNTESWFPWQNLYSVSNNGQEAGFIQNTEAGNRGLKWEKNKHFDIALEFRFLHRLGGSIEFFNRVTDDLLFNVAQPLSGGVLTQWQNSGSMYNRGIELSLNATPIANTLKWDIGLQLTHLRNEVTSLPQKEISAGYHKRMVGHSIYDYFLPVYTGVDPDNGDALYRMDVVDENENVTEVTTTNDINQATSYYCGSALPKVYGSIDNAFTYRNLTFSFRFTYRLGGKTYDEAYSGLMHSGLYGRALHTDIRNRWQQSGDITDIPRLDSGNSDNLVAPTNRWLTNASYLSLKSVLLSYQLPTQIPAFVGLKDIRLYASGENLFMLTHRKGMNPQNSFSGFSGNDYSPARIISFGIDVEF